MQRVLVSSAAVSSQTSRRKYASWLMTISCAVRGIRDAMSWQVRDRRFASKLVIGSSKTTILFRKSGSAFSLAKKRANASALLSPLLRHVLKQGARGSVGGAAVGNVTSFIFN